MIELEKFGKLVIWSLGFQKIDFEGIRFFHNFPEINGKREQDSNTN